MLAANAELDVGSSRPPPLRRQFHQLTDALETMAADTELAGGVYGLVFRGRRYDTGDRLDYIKAIVQLAVDRDDLGPDLRPWLKEFVRDLD